MRLTEVKVLALGLRILPLVSASKVHFTSRDVSGWPLWKRTPLRR